MMIKDVIINQKTIGSCTSVSFEEKDKYFELEFNDYEAKERGDVLLGVIGTINKRIEILECDIKQEVAKEDYEKDYTKIMLLQSRKKELENILG